MTEKILFGLLLTLWVCNTVWSIFRTRSERRRAGDVLLDCGQDPHMRPGCLLVGFVLFFGAAISNILSGPRDRHWFALPTLLIWLYPIIPRFFVRSYLCQNGVFWQGAFVPWAAITGWCRNPQGQLQLQNNHSKRLSKHQLVIAVELASQAEAILEQKAGKK